MKNEKILSEEILSDEQLENVAGGTRAETYADGSELVKRGLLSKDDASSSTKVREAIHSLGYKYVDHGGLAIFGAKDNEYFSKDGTKISRDEFWKNFDAENGTKIIK